MNALKWIWEFIKEEKIKYFFAMILVTVFSISTLIIPKITGYIVDEIIIGGRDNLLIVLLILVGSTLFRSIISFRYKMIFEQVSQNSVFNLRNKIFKKVQSFDFEYFDKIKAGDIMARMTGDIDAIRHFISFVIYNFYIYGMIYICAIIYMLTINVYLTLLLISVSPILYIITFYLTKNLKPAFKRIRDQYSVLNSTVQENINANRVVKAFTREKYESEKFNKENKKYSEMRINAGMVWGKYFPLIEICAGMLTVIILLFGGNMVINGNITMGELVIFSSLIWAIAKPMRMLGFLINDTQNFLTSYIKTKEILDIEEKIKNPEIETKLNSFKGSVKFKDVSFTYQDEPILKNVNFEINQGQTVAFIGATGSGKSTIINLLCRFYDIENGQILLDDINIKEISKKEIRSNISLAMQDVFLFSDTIHGNMSFGVKNIEKSDVKKVGIIADVDSFTKNMPEGYNTIIGEMGVGLSGGQKQRISIARALIKETALLILDDSTSSLDMETENYIQNNILEHKSEITKIIIAHRISSVKNAEVINVMENGEIIEYGNHSELLDKKGYYYKVFQTQIGDFDYERGE